MIKDKLAEAVNTSLDNFRKGDDYIPLNMRGELEVIVKDRDGNVLSYERGHNQVTKLAKMAIIHLLAGEIGVEDSDIFSIEHTAGDASDYTRMYSLTSGTKIFPKFVPTNHSSNDGLNLDGHLVSGEQFFFNGNRYENDSQLSQVRSTDISNLPLKFNFPTKMLFGTGVEAYDQTSLEKAYLEDFGQTVPLDTIMRLNGYTTNFESSTDFFDGCSTQTDKDLKLTNWYSCDMNRCRTLQPASTEPITRTPINTDTAIKGAIKNCFITSVDADGAKYNPTNKMAVNKYRGFGYPCFIYAKRSTRSFYNASEGNQDVYYQMNSALQESTEPYETEITYTVDMPAQPVNNVSVSTFYPYNGWILKQAGLFSDSRFKLRSEDSKTTSSYSEESWLSQINAREESGSIYRDSVGGQMLFTRNLSSPILKTADTEVVFVWHIFITV